MTTKELSFKAPVALAIAANATTPNPGLPGVWIWSSTTGGPLYWSGTAWTAVGGGGSVSPIDVVLDFGSVPTTTAQFSVTVSGLTAGTRVYLAPSGYTSSGVDFDEAEFEAITYVARCDVDGTLKIIANSTSEVAGLRIAQLSIFAGSSALSVLSLPDGVRGDITVSGGGLVLTLTGGLNALPATNNTYEGRPLVGNLAGATITQWQAVYLDSSGTWQVADANGTNTYPARGFAVAGASSGGALAVLDDGMIRNDAWALTVGAAVYLSTTAGDITQTAPSASNDKVQILGYARTVDSIRVHVTGEYLTRT